MIGPLPVTNSTAIQKLDYLYNGGKGGSVPYNGRYFDGPRSTATEPLIVSIMSNISDITAALFQGGVYYGSRDNRSRFNSGFPDVQLLLNHDQLPLHSLLVLLNRTMARKLSAT
jgi:hypothetical protein